MKLSTWAKNKGLNYKTAWNMFKRGELNAEQLPSGTIIVKEINESPRDEYNVIYCRVSSSQNKNNLDYQAKRLINFCNAKGWRIHEIVKEIVSGLNDNRPKLLQFLSKK